MDAESAPERAFGAGEAADGRGIRRPPGAGIRMTSGASHPYIPNTDDDRRAMLAAIGVSSLEELFADIPEGFRIPGLDMPAALSEIEITEQFSAQAHRNIVAGNGVASFLGGGAYRHFIPSTVAHIISRSEYNTAYTPYQPEISQG